jgi:hypothetical protein
MHYFTLGTLVALLTFQCATVALAGETTDARPTLRSKLEMPNRNQHLQNLPPHRPQQQLPRPLHHQHPPGSQRATDGASG